MNAEFAPRVPGEQHVVDPDRPLPELVAYIGRGVRRRQIEVLDRELAH